jgi:hypothetical protein
MQLAICFEVFRWVIAEILAGRGGSRYLPFHDYLANKVLKEKLDGKSLEAVLVYLLAVCTRDSNIECLDIVAYRHAKSLPLHKASNQTLAGLLAYCKQGSSVEHSLILDALEKEARRRCESELAGGNR